MNKEKLTIPGIIVLALPTFLIYFFSTSPSFKYSDDREAKVIVSFKKTTARVHDCTEEEKKELIQKTQNRQPHMRRRKDLACGSRERIPLGLKILIDKKLVVDKMIVPLGFSQDRACFIIEKFIIPVGKHSVRVEIKDSKIPGVRFDHFFEDDFNFGSREVIVIDYDSDHNKFFVRQ